MRDATIVIIGLGPAGAAAARLLAAWGHDVVAIDRPGGDAGRLAESIPPSAKKILRTIGALDDIDAAGFLPWRGNTVWWAADEPRVERFPANDAGYQVLRRDFDARLRALAIDAGVRVVEGRVTAIARGAPHAGETQVSVEAPEPSTFRARMVIDASGRSGVLGRDGNRVFDSARRTIALAASWRRDRWPLADDSHTLVASYPGGWAWSVPVIAAIRQFTVMVDPARSGLTRGRSSRDVYRDELAKIAPFQPILAGAEPVDAPWGADASEYVSRRYAGPGYLLAGDAGSAISPLSSFGVKKALASGWLAAIAVHTAIETPDAAGDAIAFFDRRERAVAAAAARQASVFANEAAADRDGGPFWIARASSAALSGATDDIDILDIEPDAAALARDPTVVAAFEDLRARESIHLRRGDAVRVEPRAAVRGRLIQLEDQLVSPAWPAGVRHLRGVDLVALIRLAPAFQDVGDLYEAVRSAAPGVSLPDFLGALSVMLARGDLRHA